MKKQFYDEFSGKPRHFVATVRDILTKEKYLLAAGKTVDHFLEELKGKVANICTLMKECENTRKDFVIHDQNLSKMYNEIQSLSLTPKSHHRDQQIQQFRGEKLVLEQIVNGKRNLLLEERMVVMNDLSNIQQSIANISTRIKKEVSMWKACYQKFLSGKQEPVTLDTFQPWFESLSDILLELISQYKLLPNSTPISCSLHNDVREKIVNLKQDLINCLKQHIKDSFVVEQLPRQVIKTQTKFKASVTLLVGSKFDLQMNCPVVTVSLLSEKQCKDLVKGKSLAEIGTCGEILNDKCIMEYRKGNNESPVLQACFKNLQLKNIQRKDKEGQESVLETKNALVFSTELKIIGDSLSVIAISAPVVIVVHSNQIPKPEGSILWDNMFSNPEREPFVTPDSVTWQNLSYALNIRWQQSNERQLRVEHLQFLQDKILSTFNSKSGSSIDTNIPWSSFNKDPVVVGKDFTFWEWFYGAIEIVRKNLKDYWMYGALEFCTKEMCKMKLLERQSGTFLIRFSEGEIGAISIAWCVERDGQKEVVNLQPWNSDDFSTRTLADRILDLPDLTHLYPNTTKERFFGHFKTNNNDADIKKRGYVTTGIFTRILPDSLNDQMDDDFTDPATPQSVDFEICRGCSSKS